MFLLLFCRQEYSHAHLFKLENISQCLVNLWYSRWFSFTTFGNLKRFPWSGNLNFENKSHAAKWCILLLIVRLVYVWNSIDILILQATFNLKLSIPSSRYCPFSNRIVKYNNLVIFCLNRIMNWFYYLQ